MERLRLENEYLNRTAAESEQIGENSDEVVDSDSDVQSDSSACFNELFDEDTISDFLSEVKICRKSKTNSRDASIACGMEWELRMSTLNPVDQICQYLEHMCKGHVVPICECNNSQSRICDTVCENLVRFFEMVRIQNSRDTEGFEYISDLVFDTVFKLAQFKDQLIVALNSPCYVEEDLRMILGNVRVLFEYYVTYGCHDTKLFFEKNSKYESLKKRRYRICCVCGIRTMLPENGEGLKDALELKDLIVVDDDDVERYLALKHDDEDEIGALAQKCFHIAFAKRDNEYYHILDLDEETVCEDNECLNPCLIKNGRLTKLPACDTCFENLVRAEKFLLQNQPSSENPSDTNFPENSSNSSSLTSDSESEDILPVALKMLKPLSFKRCDLGRIPEILGKLNDCGRTAIAPFVAFTKIKQLRSSKHLPGSAQSSTSGSKFSIPSKSVSGKEFFIPLSHDEFIKSHRRILPRKDVAVRNRIFFLGNLKNWKSMESTLNFQKKGNSFDAEQCYKWLSVLKRTGALSSDYSLRRKKSLYKLQQKISNELSSTSVTTDSSMGVVLEDSRHAKDMDSACTDDVAAARLLIDSKGVKSQAPGFTSSLFWNNSCNDGKVPLLKTVLNSIPGKLHTIQDSLLLKLKRQLPNEFDNFTKITTHTFLDLFPIPLTSTETNPLNLNSVKNRQHLLDFYDGRFSDKMFIFWLFGILTRHKSVRETCAFFKKNTEARKKYERLCNDPNLEAKLEEAINNEDSKEAKKLNEKFSSLLKTVGGNTPWSSMERKRTLGNLKALCGHFGLPSIFLTIAPCIADSEICINLCNGIKYKYTMNQSTHQERSKWTAENPVASAKAFHLIMQTVVHVFIGIKTGNIRRSTFTHCSKTGKNDSCSDDNDTVLAEAFERHLQSRQGFLGVTQAFYSIFEPQGRGALHLHAPVWTILRAELMARCNQKQLECLCKSIDRVIATWISNSSVEVEEKDKENPALNSRCALRDTSINMNGLQLESFGKRIMYRCQNHSKCSFTCFKKKEFEAHCRMCKPTKRFPKTVIHTLRQRRTETGELLIPSRDTLIDPPPPVGNLSFPIPDNRVE